MEHINDSRMLKNLMGQNLMGQKNCPNCGAPYNIELNKCPYCGTSYFDISCINIEEREPFYLKIKINGMVITQKVIVNPDVNIEINRDTVEYTGRNGAILNRYIVSQSMITSLSFTAVADSQNKHLCEVRYDMDKN